MEVLEMTEKEQAINLMDKFIDLQRIKAAGDKDKEIDYQKGRACHRPIS